MTFREDLIGALKRKYEAEIDLKRIEGEILLQHAIGEPNQTNFTIAFDLIVEQIAHIQNKINALKTNFK